MRVAIASLFFLSLAAAVAACGHQRAHDEHAHADHAATDGHGAHHGAATEAPASAATGAGSGGHACGGGGGGGMMAMGGGQGAGGPMETMMGPASPTALPPGVNAVQNEMRLLNRAMHQSMTALSLGELDKIPPLFHTVHSAKGLTEKAITDGSWKPAKGDVASFVALDEAFHKEIEKLLHLVHEKNADGVADQMAVMTKGCIGCHTAYRVPPAP